MKIDNERENPLGRTAQLPVFNEEIILERVKGIEPSYSAWKGFGG